MPPSGLCPIDAVVFDYGEVIVGADAGDWAQMVEASSIEAQSFADSYWRYRLDYDAGLTPTEYWSKVAEDCGATFTDEQVRRLNHLDAQHWMHVRPAVLDWIFAIQSAGKKIGLLSNMPLGLVPVFRRELSWFQRFDSLVFSCEVRVVKPNPAIYHASLRSLGTAPSRALFLDDKDYNVAGARALGMHGIVFESLDQVCRDIARYDLPAPALTMEGR